MNHLLTYSRDSTVCEGLLYPLLETCKKCGRLRKKKFCGDVVGEVSRCEYGIQYFRYLEDICFIGIPPALSQDIIDNCVGFDWNVVLINYILSRVIMCNEKYNQELQILHQFIKNLSKPLDYNKKGQVAPLDLSDYHELKGHVENLSNITNEVSSTISLLGDQLIRLPGVIESEIDERFSAIIPIVKTGDNPCLSMEQLKMLREKIELSNLSACISGMTCLKIKRLAEELTAIQSRFALFDDWLHDVNHYMSRIQMVIPSSGAMLMDVEAVHSLDALVDALRILKSEFEDELGISKCSEERGRQAPFEIYKLFHKYRYCFYTDDVYFVPGKKRFSRRLKPIPGIGTIALNLYHNAVKYLADYPGRHDIKTEFEEMKDSVKIVISSMGPVVGKDEIARIGEKGFRAEAARKSHRGNGRGLAKVIKVCENSGFGYKFNSERTAVDAFGFARFSASITIPNNLFVS